MADTEKTTTDAQAKPEDGKAPWGDDFDAERAWKLVQNLRTERDGLKAERDALKVERDTLATEKDSVATEGQSELQKLQARLDQIEKEAKQKDRDLALQKVLRNHPDLEEFADLLTGDTEEELAAKAERLAAIGKAKAPADDAAKDGEKDGAQALPGKPQPNLTPGHGGEDTTPFDPTAIALAARK
ncbi:head scaffolding protein [Arthrobacter phage Yang]|uniref:Scaffolding protein n=1 Tax=Arthrobacter phage Yang TaxID=2419970 RepID=A0A3G2KJC9_9CAUD|nr:head scaffolding protein [Arthrobacter phage Yang]AYN59093.1 scaffolding protein [Arthrobacter phage Yang]